MQPNSAARILFIEDDPTVARTVVEGLEGKGFVVVHAPDLATGQRELSRQAYDAAIFDITLPDGDGLDFTAALRLAGSNLPILLLTAKDSIPDRIAGLRRGADDYLCKPFDADELAARLHAQLRRSGGEERSVLRYADVQLELITRTLRRGDIKASLSDRECELMAYLIRHPEQVLSRERILQDVWGDVTEDDSNVLNVYVNYLRNKIEASRYPRVIHTVRGVGYMLSHREPDEVFFQAPVAR